jgi:hypothetical protein
VVHGVPQSMQYLADFKLYIWGIVDVGATSELLKPEWTKVTSFEVEVSWQEKISHIFNTCLAASFVGGFFLLRHSQPALLFPQAVITLLVARKVLAICSGFYIYEATGLDKLELKGAQRQARKALARDSLKCRKIALHRLSATYAAYRVTSKTIRNTGVWAIHAVGVKDAVEPHIETIARANAKLGINTLMVNGPQVGNSGGMPNRYHLGAAYEAALQYLEQVIKAQRIIMHGYSFGGAMLAEAVLNHDFKRQIERGTKYMFISDRTFSDLLSIVSLRTHGLGYPLLLLLGMQLDGVAGAKKLTELGIRHLIIQGQNESDKIIPDGVSLSKALKDNDMCINRLLVTSDQIEHGKELPEIAQQAIQKEIKLLIASNAPTGGL